MLVTAVRVGIGRMGMSVGFGVLIDNGGKVAVAVTVTVGVGEFVPSGAGVGAATRIVMSPDPGRTVPSARYIRVVSR